MKRSKKPWNKKHVSIYMEEEAIAIIDSKALEYNMSRNELIYNIIDQWNGKLNPINDTNIKEGTKQNGTGAIEWDPSNGFSADEF
jgi:hypothetical protein